MGSGLGDFSLVGVQAVLAMRVPHGLWRQAQVAAWVALGVAPGVAQGVPSRGAEQRQTLLQEAGEGLWEGRLHFSAAVVAEALKTMHLATKLRWSCRLQCRAFCDFLPAPGLMATVPSKHREGNLDNAKLPTATPSCHAIT